jgi:uncharacterized protein YjbI with pentapeptide repeats
MDDTRDRGIPNEMWSFFHLKPLQVKQWPDGVRAWITVAAIVGCCSLVACIFIISFLLVRLGWEAVTNSSETYQETTKNFLLAFASAFGAPFLVWRTWVAHQQARAASEQARVALESHLTGIFVKSVELMGLVRDSRDPMSPKVSVAPNVEARLGALYSLERLLSESEKDQRSILETLCAYVRENSTFEVPDDEGEAQEFLRGNLPPKPLRRADVQAAITIVGRRPEAVRARASREGWRLDFRNSNLTSYDFSRLNYDRADFGNSFVNGAKMARGSFMDCIFVKTFMRSCKMTGACFRSSLFDSCDLTNAEIDSTHFRKAKFVMTDLRRAKVTSLGLEGADLEGAFWDIRLKMALEAATKTGFSSFSAEEVVNTIRLFQKATWDKETVVSEVVRDIILMAPKPPLAANA